MALATAFATTGAALAAIGNDGYGSPIALAPGNAAAVWSRDGVVAATGVPDPAGSDLPTTRQTLGQGDIAAFLVHDSATTQIVGDGESADKHRIVRWASDGFYASRRTYAVLGFRMVAGVPGRMYDWHTQPDDVGGWSPPCSGGGVAPLAIDYWGNARGLEIVAEQENAGCSRGRGRYHFQVLSQAEVEARRGQWVWLWMEITWGRRDLATKGSLTVWVAGEKRARVNVSGVNTHWPQQEMITFWEGAYHHSGSPSTNSVEIAATRFGRTPREAYEDVPFKYKSFTADAPSSSSLTITRRRHTEARVPTALRWGAPGGTSTSKIE